MARLEVHEWTTATKTAAEVIEYEVTDDGRYIVTARWVQRARQAFMDGNRAPLLALQHTHYSPTEIAPSPHLSRLLIEIIIGRIKRPKHRPKTTQPLTITEITDIGIRVREAIKMGDNTPCNDRLSCCPDPLNASRWHPIKRQAAIARVAKGVPSRKDIAIQDLMDLKLTREQAAAMVGRLMDPKHTAEETAAAIQTLIDLGLTSEKAAFMVFGMVSLDDLDLSDFERVELPPIPIGRVRAAYSAFLKLQGEPRPWDGQPDIPCETKPTRKPKRKPATPKSSRPKQSSRPTRFPHTTRSTPKP